MIGININVKKTSPFLQTVHGKFEVDNIEYGRSYEKIVPLCHGSFSHRMGNRFRYHVEGEYKKLFKRIRPQLEIMISSYTRGLIMAPHDHSFIDNSKEKDLEEWIEQERINK